MLFRFVHEVQIGDYIVYPSKVDRTINLGIVEGEYAYCPEATEYVQQRAVKWIKKLPRTAFSQGALYEIGSAMSFFMVKNYAEEFLEHYFPVLRNIPLQMSRTMKVWQPRQRILLKVRRISFSRN